MSPLTILPIVPLKFLSIYVHNYPTYRYGFYRDLCYF